MYDTGILNLMYIYTSLYFEDKYGYLWKNIKCEMSIRKEILQAKIIK